MSASDGNAGRPGPRQAAPSASSDAFYWQLDARLPAAGEELWGLFCVEHGALGAEALSPFASAAEPRADAPRDVRHFFAAIPPLPGLAPFTDADAADWGPAFVAAFVAAYPGVPAPLHAAARRERSQAWETAWRVHFTPLRLGRRLRVVPPWDVPGEAAGAAPAAADDSARLRIVIEPGQGFGTGWHPSTALALLSVEDALDAAPAAGPPARMADVGCGSGILAIAARLLGVPAAVALDVDAVALPEVRRNFALSGLAPPAVVQGRPDCLRGPFPLLAANIVAEVLHAHRDDLCRLTAPGGCLILSGILAAERDGLLGAYVAGGLALARERRQDGWVALALRRPRSGNAAR